MRSQEHHEQVALFRLAALHERRYPELTLLYAVPNAARRSPRQGAWMKAEGLKAGVPDIHLPVAAGGYIGLWIELKAGRNKPTEAQERWHNALKAMGHKVCVCYSAQAAWDEITRYLDAKVGRAA